MTPLEITNLLIGSASLLIGGINLAFILKILFNELHELRALFVEHLRDHTKRE